MIGFYNYTVIPTYMGLVSSVLGIHIALHGRHPFLAVMCLMFSGLCDMYDGKIARTKERNAREKKFGIQIDSLCDLVCFGVLPVVIGYSLGLREAYYIPVYAFYILTAVIRLAYFNVLEEERQSETDEKREYYTGLPVTSVALLLPFVFGLKVIIGKYMPCLYATALVLIGIAFISRFKVKKPHGKLLLVVLAVGIIELVLLVLCVILK